MAKILIIEDSADIRENTVELLEIKGHDILVASNGKEGCEIAMKHLPDLILCDVVMPEMDGFGVLQAMQANEKTAGTPFIFCTASAQKSEIEKGFESGAFEYLTKPYGEEELFALVDRFLG